MDAPQPIICPRLLEGWMYSVLCTEYYILISVNAVRSFQIDTSTYNVIRTMFVKAAGLNVVLVVLKRSIRL